VPAKRSTKPLSVAVRGQKPKSGRWHDKAAAPPSVTDAEYRAEIAQLKEQLKYLWPLQFRSAFAPAAPVDAVSSAPSSAPVLTTAALPTATAPVLAALPPVVSATSAVSGVATATSARACTRSVTRAASVGTV
jgi:hypothetical protein